MSTESEAGAPPGEPALLLEVRGIEKSFPGVRALSGVSFDVRPREVHALLGENGAGKSTLIKIMSGVYQPDVGSILVNGTQVDFSSPDDARRAGVATIYQELAVVSRTQRRREHLSRSCPAGGRRSHRLAGDADGGETAA